MNRDQLLAMVAVKAHGRGLRGFVTSKEVDLWVRAVGDAIVELTSRGEVVRAPGLGTFKGRTHKRKSVIDPNGQQHVIPRKTVLVFRASKHVRTLRQGSP